MERDQIEQKIKNEIELIAGKEVTDNDMEIFKDGFLDSLNVMHIIVFMETEFKLSINPFDLTIDMLSSVNKIVDFVMKKI